MPTKRIKIDLSKLQTGEGKSPFPERGILPALKAGFSQSTPGLLQAASSGKMPEEYNPRGVAENVAYYAGEFGPDLPLWALASAATGGVGGGLIAGGKVAAQQALKAGAKKAILKGAAKWAAGRALRGAAVFGGVEAVRSPLRQKAYGKDITAKQTLKDVAGAAATGGVFDVGLGALGAGVKAIGRKALPKGLKIPLGAGSKARTSAFSQADRAAKGHMAGQELEELIGIGLAKQTPKGVRYLQNVSAKTLKGTWGQLKGKAAKGRFAQNLFVKRMEAMGYDASKLKGDFSLGEQFLNISELGDKLAQETGAPTAGWAQRIYRTINTADSANKVNQKAILQFQEVFKKSGLTDESFASIRGTGSAVDKTFNSIVTNMREQYISIGGNIKWLDKYIPLRSKVYLKGAVKRARRGAKKVKQTLGTAEHARAKVGPSEELMIKNPVELLNRYANEIKRKQIQSLIPQNNAIFEHLNLLGMNEKATQLQKVFAKATGLSVDKVKTLHALNFVEKGKLNVQKMEALQNIWDADMTADIYQKIGRSMYKSWMGLSPSANVKQFLQPYLVGSAEIGTKYVRYGLKARRHLSGEEQLMAKKAITELAPASGKIDLLEVASKLKTEPGMIEKMLTFAGEPGMKLFQWQDVYRNRMSMFLGARKQLLTEGIGKNTMQGLLPGQKAQIERIASMKGIKEAAYEYGIMRSLRINFMYHTVDKPLILQGGIAQYIPFTTWGRNQWMRFLGDAANGDAQTIAKRLAYPIAYLTAIEMATGVKISNAHPASSMAGVLDPRVAPAITETGKLLGQGKYAEAGKQALTAIPITNLLTKIKKGVEKGPIRGLSMRESTKPNLPTLLKDMYKRRKK